MVSRAAPSLSAPRPVAGAGGRGQEVLRTLDVWHIPVAASPAVSAGPVEDDTGEGLLGIYRPTPNSVVPWSPRSLRALT